MNFITKKPTMADRFFSLFAVFALVFTTSGLPPVYALTSDENTEKVTICHSTNSHENPYVEQQPNKNADVTGHDGHDGPVWYAGIAEDWGDIIPPFEYDGGSYPGKNWTEEGITIHNNNCAIQTVVQTGSITVTKVVPDYDGDWSFDFTGINQGFTLTLTDDSETFSSLPIGNYTIQEVLPEGFSFDGVECVGAEEISNSIQYGITVHLQADEDVTCTFTNTKDHDDENTCLSPSVSGDLEPFTIEESGETPLQTILDKKYGTGAVSASDDQMNYQVWDLTTANTDYIKFDVTILGKEAGNAQTFGYYKAGVTSSFVPLVSIPPSAVGTVLSVSIPASFADSLGFGIETNGLNSGMWHSEFDFNTGDKDNVAAYNPSVNTYVLAFEDQEKGDNDYNDLVMEIKDVTCVEDNTPKEDITMCKYDSAGAPQEGWEMTLSNGTKGVTYTHFTLKNGCVTASVNPEEGPWMVTEEGRPHWTLEDVEVHNGDPLLEEGSDDVLGCKFFDMQLYQGDDSLFAEAVAYKPTYKCDFTNKKHEDSGEIVNTCIIPSAEDDYTIFAIGSSNEISLYDILSSYGYGYIDILNDQKNYQTWTFAPSIEQVTFDITVLGKYAGNKQAFLYYEAGNGKNFVPLFKTTGHSAGAPEANMGDTISVTIPQSFANTIGFAMHTEGYNPDTWHSEFELNTNDKDNVAVYNPESNKYLLGFEDQLNDDNDYNDLVIKIDNMECGDIPDNGDNTKIVVERTGSGSCINCGSSSTDNDDEESTPEGETQGESDSREQDTSSENEPSGEVFGEQTSIVPLTLGLNTGAGGTSSKAPSTAVPLTALMFTILGALMLRVVRVNA